MAALLLAIGPDEVVSEPVGIRYKTAVVAESEEDEVFGQTSRKRRDWCGLRFPQRCLCLCRRRCRRHSGHSRPGSTADTSRHAIRVVDVSTIEDTAVGSVLGIVPTPALRQAVETYNGDKAKADVFVRFPHFTEAHKIELRLPRSCSSG